MLPAKIILAELTLFVNNNLHKMAAFFCYFFYHYNKEEEKFS